jgi:hypothetical protein
MKGGELGQDKKSAGGKEESKGHSITSSITFKDMGGMDVRGRCDVVGYIGRDKGDN